MQATDIIYTDGEVSIAFECLLGMPARQADIEVIRLMGSPTPSSVAEYIWDHWMGEPEETSTEQLEQCLLENDWIILDDGTEIIEDHGTYTLQALIVPSEQEGAWDVSPVPVALAVSTDLDALLAEARQLAERKRQEAVSDRGPNQIG